MLACWQPKGKGRKVREGKGMSGNGRELCLEYIQNKTMLLQHSASHTVGVWQHWIILSVCHIQVKTFLDICLPKPGGPGMQLCLAFRATLLPEQAI